MKKLAFAMLGLATLTQATGCIIVSDDEDEGAFVARWNLLPDGTDCAAVGATTVSVLSTPVGSTVGIEDLFDCQDLSAQTAALPVDVYTVAVDILDATDQPLSAAPAILGNQEIPADGAIVDLPVV